MDARAYLLLGMIDGRAGRSAEAIVSLRRALYLDDALALAYFWLGNLYRDRGDADRACGEHLSWSAGTAAHARFHRRVRVGSDARPDRARMPADGAPVEGERMIWLAVAVAALAGVAAVLATSSSACAARSRCSNPRGGGETVTRRPA